MTFEQWLAIVSIALTLAALAFTWAGWRRAELRREDVLAWGNEAIEVLQTLVLICIDEEKKSCPPDARLGDLRYRTSILVERGRLFFRNAKSSVWGAPKEPAYRGFRPCILDPLVVGHQIAAAWPSASGADRARIRLVAQDSMRKFVSLLQKEVGRDRTASADTSVGGNGASLSYLIARADPGAPADRQ